MAKARWLWLAAGTGLLAGNLVRRLSLPAAEPGPAASSAPIHPKREGGTKGSPYSAPGWNVRDGVDAAELQKHPAGARRTAEAALWLGSADAAGLAAWYASLIAGQPQDGDLLDLLMSRWMELDPLGALAVVSGKDLEERRAWWTWGMIDPEAAVKEAEARDSGYLTWIARGAAFTNPKLAMQLMELHPGMSFPGIQDTLRMGFQDQGWQEALEFSYSSYSLRSWAKEEPAKAFEWAVGNLRKVQADWDSNSGFWQGLIGNLEDSEVKDAIAKLPSGRTRQELETALLKRLIDRDVDAAFTQARAASTAPERVRMLAEIGSALALRDPARSLETLREMLASGEGKSSVHQVLTPESGKPSQAYPVPVGQWTERLAAQDPVKVMGLLEASPEGRNLSQYVAGNWMARDFEGYSQWAWQLPPGDSSDQHFWRIGQRLSSKPEQPLESYSQSLAWVERIGNEDLRRDAVPNMIQRWIRGSPETAAAYFTEGGAAPANQRAEYESLMEHLKKAQPPP